jgi:RNA polymerase sigma factor (sigma-70 family)
MVNHKAVVRAILDGDRDQFNILIKDFQRLVSHIVYRMIPDEHDREDICQEVFVKVYQNLAGFRFDSKLSTWVAKVAFNTCLSHRDKKQFPLYDNTIETNEDGSGEAAMIETARPDISYETENVAEKVRHEIDQLPPLYGTIITLFHLEQLSLQEIAEIMRTPEGTIKSYLFRGRKMLKDRLIRRYNREEL